MAFGKFLRGIFQGENARSASKVNKPEQDWVVFTRRGNPDEIISIDLKSPQLNHLGYENFFSLHFAFTPEMLNEHGMPLPRMADLYYGVEDDLERNLPSVIKVASKATPGVRRVWFAANTDILATAKAELDKVKALAVTAASDSQSSVGNLLPTDIEMQKIQNYKILDSIGQHGDDGKAAREVRHWMYRNDNAASNKLETAIKKLGYSIQESDNERIVFSKECSLLLDELDSETEELNKLAERFGANYDGWETPVVKAKTSFH